MNRARVRLFCFTDFVLFVSGTDRHQQKTSRGDQQQRAGGKGYRWCLWFVSVFTSAGWWGCQYLLGSCPLLTGLDGGICPLNKKGWEKAIHPPKEQVHACLLAHPRSHKYTHLYTCTHGHTFSPTLSPTPPLLFSCSLACPPPPTPTLNCQQLDINPKRVGGRLSVLWRSRCMHAYLSTQTHMDTHIYTHTGRHARTHMHAHTHRHTHTHTHTLSIFSPSCPSLSHFPD